MEDLFEVLIGSLLYALPYLIIIILVFVIWRNRAAPVRGLFAVAFCAIFLAGVERRTGSHWLLLVAAVSFAGAMALETWAQKGVQGNSSNSGIE